MPEPSDIRKALVAADGISRRELLLLGGVGVAVLAVGGIGVARLLPANDDHAITLRAVESNVQLGSISAVTWTFDGTLPGRELRIKQGRPARIKLVNELSQPTTVHWHGIRLDNAADGVPGMTQSEVMPGDEFIYEFVPPDAGTFFFHSHVGTQLDRGMYAPLIVEARNETLDYDEEAVLVIDDWLDGIDGNPDARLAELQGGEMNGMAMGATGVDRPGRSTLASLTTQGSTSTLAAGHASASAGDLPSGDLGSLASALEAGRFDPGDIPGYPLYLINGRPPEDPFSITAARGDRLRLRLINASGDTIYRVFVEDHELEVVAADGMPVRGVRTDSVVMGMGERYDALVDVGEGISRVIAVPLGKDGEPAVAYLRPAGAGQAAPPPAAPFRTPRRVLAYEQLRPTEEAESKAGNVQGPREIELDLDFRAPYEWTIGGQLFADAEPVTIDLGEPVRFTMRNKTMMPHPMHLHGHSFAVNGPGGPIKDTALALPGRRLTLDWVADNPGVWAYHCHNVYHQGAGMMRRVEVT